MKKLNQNGFGFLYWLLLLLVLILLGLAGWWVYSKNKKPKNSTPQSQQQISNAPVEDPTYLEIKEWGVRVKLSANIKTAYYLIKPSSPNYAYLSLTALKNIDCAADKTTLGVYTRINSLNDVNNDTAGTDGQTYAEMGYESSPQAGGKHYYFSQPQAYCSNNAAQDQAYWQDFKSDLSTVQTTP